MEGSNAGQLWRRRLDALEATPIAGTEGGRSPSFSHDGLYLSFFADGQIGVIPARGGMPVWVDGAADHAHAWGDDGAIYWNGNNRIGPGLRRWVPGTVEAQVSDFDPGDGRVSDVLPGSEALLFSSDAAGVAVVDRESGDRQELGLGRYARYIDTGHIVFAREDGTLAVQAFDLRSREATGLPVSTSAVIRVTGGGAEYALGADGTLVYETGAMRGGEELAWADADGNIDVIDWAGPGAANYDGVSLDPSGRRAAVGLRRPGESFGTGDIWLLDLGAGTGFPLTRDGTSVRPDWHPANGRIAYVSQPSDQNAARWLAADGSAAGEHIVDLATPSAPPQVRWVGDDGDVVLRMSGVSTRSIFSFAPGADAPNPWLDGEFDQVNPAPSPDGVWLAYDSDRSGRAEVYVQPYPGGGAVTQISSEGGQDPAWSPTGEEIYFLGAGYLWRASVSVDGSGMRVGSRERLFEFTGRSFDVGPDGRFLIALNAGASGSGDLVLVRNWVQDVLGAIN